MKNFSIGIAFAALWASASVATKFGITQADPLILANLRFFIAGILLLLISYFLQSKTEFRLPNQKEWKQLVIFGGLNTALYLSLYVWAMKYTAAGIGSLATATSPLFITIISTIWLKKRPSLVQMLCLLLGFLGVLVASYPLLQNGSTSTLGMTLILTSMFVISLASVYYASVEWKLSNLLINGWQVTIGGLLLLPITLIFGKFSESSFEITFWISVLWLSIAVSVVGLICWFHLLKIDTIKASIWLFLCPIFGFLYANFFMNEPITWYTITGTFIVITGLLITMLPKLKSK